MSLPISVLLPTRNSMALLPQHLETMGPWRDLVEEVVVVDSGSEDGTVDCLAGYFKGAGVRVFQQPPGLYSCWNFGISEIRSPYTYISTVGDEISREGLMHLYEVAERLACDVVISPPAFVSGSGSAVGGNSWPVHEIISILKMTTERQIGGVLPFMAAVAFLPFAMLGSSASNLYRTSTMQRRPFPTDCGLNGDGAWGVIHALEIRLGITPRCVSKFRKHAKSYSPESYAVRELDRKIFDKGMAVLGAVMSASPEVREEAARLGLESMIEAKAVVLRWRAELLRYREMAWPWVMNPAAWRVRSRRILAQAHCDALLRKLLEEQMGERCADVRASFVGGVSLRGGEER